MGQAASVHVAHAGSETSSRNNQCGCFNLKSRQKRPSRNAASEPVRASSFDCIGQLVEQINGTGKDTGCPAAAVNCPSSIPPVRTKAVDESSKAIAPAGPSADCSPTSNQAAAFVQWAKSQSSNKQASIDDFILQHCQSDLGESDTLQVDDILAAAAAGGVLPHESCRTAQNQLAVEPFAPYNGHLKGAPKPQCHEDRISAADGINALRATRDGEIESMLRLLCHVFQVETATVALLTGEAIYITGACGALQPCVCPDRWGFCGWSFLNSHHELLVVEDMDSDARFSANYFCVDPQFHLKFYVAAPLVTSNGHRLGTLCIMGQEAGRFDPYKAQMLANLAEMLVRQLEHRWVMALQGAGNTTGLKRDLSCYSACYFVLDLSSSPWRIMHMNEPARAATGVDWGASYDELANFAAGRREKSPFEGLSLTSLFDVSSASLTWGNSVNGSAGIGSSWEFRLSGLKPAADAPEALFQGLGLSAGVAAAAAHSPDSQASYTLTCRLAISDGLDDSQPFYIGVPSWLALSEENTWGRNLFFARLEVDSRAQGGRPSSAGVQAQQAFQGDSVQELMTLTAKILKQHDAVVSSNSSSSSINVTPTAATPAADVVSDGSSRRTSLESSSAVSFSASQVMPCWLPRGMSTLPPHNSSSFCSGAGTSSRPGSIAGNSNPSTPSAAAGGASPFDSASENAVTPASAGKRHTAAGAPVSGGSRASSVKSFQTGISSSQLPPVVCRGLPIPGLLMGPLVGRGSYGKVYRGLWKGRPVAVKIIDDISSLKLTKAGEPLEISLTKNLKHLGIMSTLTYTYSDASAVPTSSSKTGGSSRQRTLDTRPGRRVCWMLFEYCDKGVLADAVVRGWFRTIPNPLKGAPHIRVVGLTALEIAVAMKHLHDQGVLHGDLCGGNVMLTKSSSTEHGFTAKVGDFGLARIHTGDANKAGNPVDQRLGDNAYGTITHQPPEVLLEGGDAFTPAADVYAWGVLLWEMLTGTRAWAGMAAPAVVCQVAVLKRSLAIPKHLPKTLEELLTRALSHKPSDRPGFGEIVEVLTRFVQESRAVDWAGWQAEADAGQEEMEAEAILEFEEAAKARRCCMPCQVPC